MSYCIVFRTYPDVDHMVPLAWVLLEAGENVHAIISHGYDPYDDYRLRSLTNHERFQLHRVEPRGVLAPLWRLWRGTLPWALGFLIRHRIRLLAVEWGHGPQAEYDRPLSPAGLYRLARDTVWSLIHVRRCNSHQTRTSFMLAARILRQPTVCLPHGLNIKLDAISTKESEILHEHPYAWHDRNRFAAYVLNTEHHRQWHLDHANGDPQVMQTWGSLRWAPRWFERNLDIAPTYQWPGGEGYLRVVFMVPKWQKKVHAEQVVELARRLHNLDFVSLAIKGHPRPEDGSADPLRDDPLLDWSRIADATALNSVSLIRASDVVIDVGSSIGIETVMQGKVLVNPTYIHELTTLFDVMPGTCVVAASIDEVVTYLEHHHAGGSHEVSQSAYDEMMRRCVYGDGEPFDPLALYVRRIRELAGDSLESATAAPQSERVQVPVNARR